MTGSVTVLDFKVSHTRKKHADVAASQHVHVPSMYGSTRSHVPQHCPGNAAADYSWGPFHVDTRRCMCSALFLPTRLQSRPISESPVCLACLLPDAERLKLAAKSYGFVEMSVLIASAVSCTWHVLVKCMKSRCSQDLLLYKAM